MLSCATRSSSAPSSRACSTRRVDSLRLSLDDAFSRRLVVRSWKRSSSTSSTGTRTETRTTLRTWTFPRSSVSSCLSPPISWVLTSKLDLFRARARLEATSAPGRSRRDLETTMYDITATQHYDTTAMVPSS